MRKRFLQIKLDIPETLCYAVSARSNQKEATMENATTKKEMEGEEAMEMFKLVKSQGGLPTTIDDLVPISFIGQAAVKFYQAKIKLMDQLGMTEAQRKATLRDGQDAGEMLLDIEARIGELAMAEKQVQPKVTSTGPGTIAARPSGQPPKHERLGLPSEKHMRNAQTIHNNPIIVAKIKAQARENEDIPTKTAVLNAIHYEKEKERQAAAAPVKEAMRRAYPEKDMLYINSLDQCIRVLPQKPHQDWNENAFREAKAKAIIIKNRLEVFTCNQSKSITG
jgi:hypothetical protein